MEHKTLLVQRTLHHPLPAFIFSFLEKPFAWIFNSAETYTFLYTKPLIKFGSLVILKKGGKKKRKEEREREREREPTINEKTNLRVHY